MDPLSYLDIFPYPLRPTKALSIFYLLFCDELWHYHNSTLHKHIVLLDPDLLVPNTGFNVCRWGKGSISIYCLIEDPRIRHRSGVTALLVSKFASLLHACCGVAGAGQVLGEFIRARND